MRCASLFGLTSLSAFFLALPMVRADDRNPPKSFMGLPLLYADDFEKDSTERWEPTDPKAWKLVKQGDNQVFSQFAKSEYKPPVRTPFNRALLKDLFVSDFVLEARVQSTVKDYNHRDMCLFLGYQDPAHHYYVHLGKKADPHANSIFLVDGKDRVSIARQRTEGTNWDDHWHRVRIVRKVDSGSILVYFDDMDKPVMTTEDKKFTWGRIGIGSFDDTGNFDDIRLWGVKVEGKP
jgi:hypothetical protein